MQKDLDEKDELLTTMLICRDAGERFELGYASCAEGLELNPNDTPSASRDQSHSVDGMTSAYRTSQVALLCFNLSSS